jgi:hypothetical protein
MDNLTDMWKPLAVYIGASTTVLLNIIEGIHAVVSLMVVTGTFIFILYQIIEKEKQRRESNRKRSG